MRHFATLGAGLISACVLAGAASASVDTNGGASWGGWTLYGQSDAAGIYASGTNGSVYRIYQTVFRFDSQTMSLGAGYSGSSFTSSGANASQMFAYNNLIYGLGVERVSGTGTIGTTTVGFDFGNDSYQAANAAGGARISTSGWSQTGDANVQFFNWNSGQIGVQTGNGTNYGGVSNFAYSGTSGLSPESFAFRCAGNGTTMQMFFDITAMNSLYTSAGAFAGWTVGMNAVPNGEFAPNQFRISLDLASSFGGARTFVQSSDIWAAPIPAPGALALLGLAGLAGARRRR
ncbi:MAG: hypothetical protein LW806_11690 [Planctomycetaceae bacterium]|jgi:MYXO-CTERM domain-containing protein|nr:hypothetical protein [Planctomycetaceae bacterium]